MVIKMDMRQFRVILIVLSVLIAASLACALPSTSATQEEPSAAEVVPAEEVEEEPAVEEEAAEPTALPTSTPEPTATPEPLPTPTPEPKGITVDNVGDIREVRQIPVSSSILTAGSFSPTEHHAASFGYDKVVRIWDADTGDLVTELVGHGDWGIGLEYSPDGTMLVSGGKGGDVRLWNLGSGSLIAKLTAPATRIYDAAWSRDGQNFAVAGERSSRVIVFDDNGTQVQEVKAGSGWVWSVGFSKEYMAAGSDSGTVYIFDADTFGSVQDVTYAGRTPARGLEFTPDGSVMAACFRDGVLHFYNTDGWGLEHKADAHPGSKCMDGVFSAEGDVYFSVGDDGRMVAWNVSNGSQLKTLEFDSMIWAVSISGDGKLLALSLDDGSVRIVGLPK